MVTYKHQRRQNNSIVVVRLLIAALADKRRDVDILINRRVVETLIGLRGGQLLTSGSLPAGIYEIHSLIHLGYARSLKKALLSTSLGE